jgi:hypothetical protein
MVRLRMELKSEKDRIMSYLRFPGPQFYVNVKDDKDFDLVYVLIRLFLLPSMDVLTLCLPA